MKKITMLFMLLLFIVQSTYGEASGAWISVETEHFIFVFKERDREAARELATFCDDAYALVTGYFHSYPFQIRCVITGDTDLANGANMSNPASLIINVASPGTPWLGAKTDNWLKAVFIHELTHFVHLHYTRGFFAFLSGFLGDEVKGFQSAFIYSGWMIEGITTNLETLFSSGGRGRNPLFEMYYKAMILDDSLFSRDQSNYSSSFPPPGRIYVAGYMLVHYMMETFGRDVFARVHEEYIAFPFLGPEKALITVTGASFSEIYAGMKTYYENYFSSYGSIRGGVRFSPRAIGNYYLPLVTKRGLILYRDTLEKRASIVLFDPDTSKEETIVEADLHDETSLTSDESGNIIVFSSDVYDFRIKPEIVSADLFRYDAKSRSVSRLTHDAHLFQPALSSDGSRLFAVQRTGSYSRLVEVNPVTGNLRILFDSRDTNVYNPEISPDGSAIVFVRNIRGMQDIYIIPTDAPTALPENNGRMDSWNEDKASPLLPENYAGDYFPHFSGNETIVFSSDREGSLSLYSYSMKNKVLTRIAEDPVAAISGKIIGDSLVYSSYSAEGYCLKQLPQASLDSEVSILWQPEKRPPSFDFKELPQTNAYLDLPAPLFWFPYPSINLSPLAAPDVGIGFYTYAGSLLRKSWWSLNGTFSPAYLQPRLTLAGAYDFDVLSMYLDLSQDYASANSGVPSFSQNTSCILELDVPFVSDYSMTLSRYVFAQAGIYYVYSLTGSSSFPFGGEGYAGELDISNLLLAYGAFGLQVSKNGGAYDFFAPFQISARVSASTLLPVFEGSIPGFAVAFDSSVNIPSLVEHQVISPGVSITYASRSFGIQADDFRAILSLDYLFPIALLDTAFYYGLSLLDLSGRFFWLYGLDYSLESGNFSPDRFMYAGVELGLTIGEGGYYRFPLVAGIAVRIDTVFGEPWSLMSNLMPYISINFGRLFDSQRKNTSFPGFRRGMDFSLQRPN